MLKKFLLSAAFVLAVSSTSAQAYDCSEPKAYIESVKNEVLGILESSTPNADKRNKLDSIFRNVTDGAWMSKFVLGRNYSKLTPEQQSEYANIYADYLSASYVDRFREFNGEVVTVDGVKPVNNDFAVDTTIQRKQKGPVSVTYRLHKAGSCFKVKDISAEGVSLINTQRQEFGSVVSNKGYEGLVEALKTKTEKYKSGELKAAQ